MISKIRLLIILLLFPAFYGWCTSWYQPKEELTIFHLTKALTIESQKKLQETIIRITLNDVSEDPYTINDSIPISTLFNLINSIEYKEELYMTLSNSKYKISL
jgi:hypothetical protein